MTAQRVQSTERKGRSNRGSKPGEKRGAAKGGFPGPGRKPGVPNRVTTEFRETVQKLLDENRENVSKWLKQIAEGEPAVYDRKGNEVRPAKPADPATALLRISYLAEFAAPKLSRTEVTGEGGGALTVVINTLASPEAGSSSVTGNSNE